MFYISKKFCNELNTLEHLLEPVTYPIFCNNMFGLIWIIFNFFSECTYKNPQILGLSLTAHSPYFFKYILVC